MGAGSSSRTCGIRKYIKAGKWADGRGWEGGEAGGIVAILDVITWLKPSWSLDLR